MNKQKIIIYGVIPIGTTLTLVLMYFSGIDVLRNIVAPTIPGIYGNSSREFGLLENLQNVVLIAMIVIIAVGIRRKASRVEMIGLFLAGCFTLFVFLEEIDYGLHYYEYARGIQAEDAAEVRNFHNVGGRTRIMKRALDFSMVLAFFILPIALHNSKNVYIRYLLPDRYSVLTLIGSLVISSVAHGLRDRGFAEGGPISKNISEFRELSNYYLFMLYVVEVALKRRLHPEGQAELEHDTSLEAVVNEKESP